MPAIFRHPRLRLHVARLESGRRGSARPHTRRQTTIEQHLADWCTIAARTVRGGASLSEAVATATNDVTPASRVRASRPRPATRREPHRPRYDAADAHDDSSRLVVAVVRTCARLGGSAAEPLDRTAAVMHVRMAALEERKVHSAQARLSAVVLSVTPLAVLSLLVAVEPSVRSAFHLPATWVCLGTGLALNGIGWWWMRRIISGVRRPAHAGGAGRARLSDRCPMASSCSSAACTPAWRRRRSSTQ